MADRVDSFEGLDRLLESQFRLKNRPVMILDSDHHVVHVRKRV